MKKRLVRLLAWAVTAGILFLLFRKIPFHEVVAAARGAAGWTVPAAFFFGFVIYLADSFAIWKTFGWFLAQLSLTDVLLVRGATYLLAAINYNVGQGAIVYFVHRVARVPVIRGVATVLLIMGINVLALLFLATFGLAAAPAVPHAVKVIVAVAYAGLAVYVAAVIAKPRWLASRPLFDVLLGAGLGGHARALLVRLPHIAILFTFQICHAARVRRRRPDPAGDRRPAGGLPHRGAADLRAGARHHPGGHDLLLRALRGRATATRSRRRC